MSFCSSCIIHRKCWILCCHQHRSGHAQMTCGHQGRDFFSAGPGDTVCRLWGDCTYVRHGLISRAEIDTVGERRKCVFVLFGWLIRLMSPGESRAFLTGCAVWKSCCRQNVPSEKAAADSTCLGHRFTGQLKSCTFLSCCQYLNTQFEPGVNSHSSSLPKKLE